MDWQNIFVNVSPFLTQESMILLIWVGLIKMIFDMFLRQVFWQLIEWTDLREGMRNLALQPIKTLYLHYHIFYGHQS